MDRKSGTSVSNIGPLAGDLISIKEAASILHVSISTAYRMMERRQLPWTKIGGHRRIPRSALDAVARSNFVGDPALLAVVPAASTGHVSMDSSKDPRVVDHVRKALSEHLRRVEEGPDRDLEYAYRRVSADFDAQARKGAAS
jgi:excisionase family DNA binding protein